MTDLVQRLQSERSPLCLEVARLRDAKRGAMQIADVRAKEVVDLRMRLAKSYAVDVSMISLLRRKFMGR